MTVKVKACIDAIPLGFTTAGRPKLFTYLFISLTAYFIDKKLMQYLPLFHLPHSSEDRIGTCNSLVDH